MKQVNDGRANLHLLQEDSEKDNRGEQRTGYFFGTSAEVTETCSDEQPGQTVTVERPGNVICNE